MTRKRALALLFIFLLAFSVRALTANFIRAHLSDAAWFPYGIYAVFDRTAQDGLDGRASFFWIDDPSRTDTAIYPPGYPLWLALIYSLTGSRSATTVQTVQWILDALSVFLIVGVGVSAFGWSAGLWAGAVAAVWPLLALYGALPLADAPTGWIVMAGVWMLLLAAKRQSIGWALGVAALIGVSCWLRANGLLLVFFWALILLVVVRATLRVRLLLISGLILSATVFTAPIILRNAVAFHALVPTGLGAGTNLWEGIGESPRGRTEFGAPVSDAELIEQERAQLNIPRDKPFNLYYPDGIRRDRERMRKALSVIGRHPFWYSGVVLRRMAGLVKYAGAPLGDYGSAGINVTSKKCLRPESQGGSLALSVNVLGMLQSILRYALIPIIIIGVIFAFRFDPRVSAILMVTVFYYWVVNSMMHTHIRYTLPMHALFSVFAGSALSRFQELASRRGSGRINYSQNVEGLINGG